MRASRRNISTKSASPAKVDRIRLRQMRCSKPPGVAPNGHERLGHPANAESPDELVGTEVLGGGQEHE